MPRTRWFDDGSCTVYDWHCPGHALAVGPEECMPAHEISIGQVGSHAVRMRDGETVVECTQFLCLNAGDAFRPVRRAIGLERRTQIAVGADLLRAVIPGARDRRLRFRARAVPLTARAALAHHELVWHAHPGHRDELAIHTLALELVAHACRAAAPPPATRPTPAVREAVRAVQELLVRRHAERWTLSALATHVGLSPWHLSRSFRAHIGIGLHQYRTRLRLLSALARLRDSRRPELARIAFDLGFSSHSHLTREFRAFFRVAPSRIVDRSRAQLAHHRPMLFNRSPPHARVVPVLTVGEVGTAVEW
jgi:AraC family transcriptional regulator